MNDMNISSLLALEQTGDIAKAADKLCKTPQAILYNIHRLEEELSLSLVSGSGQNLQITPAGQQFCCLFRQMEQQLSFAKLHLPGKNADSELCIGHGAWCGMPESIARAVQVFAQNNPHLLIHARCLAEKELSVLLKTGSIDLLLIPMPTAMALFPQKDCLPVLDLPLYSLHGTHAANPKPLLYADGYSPSPLESPIPPQPCADWDAVYSQVAFGHGWTVTPKNERIAHSPLFLFSPTGESVTLCAVCLHPEKADALRLAQHIIKGGLLP